MAVEECTAILTETEDGTVAEQGSLEALGIAEVVDKCTVALTEMAFGTMASQESVVPLGIVKAVWACIGSSVETENGIVVGFVGSVNLKTTSSLSRKEARGHFSVAWGIPY